MIAATLKSSKASKASKATTTKACATCPRARRSSTSSSLRRILRKTARAPRRPLALKNALAAPRPAAAAKRASPVPAAYVRHALAHTGAGASMYAALQTTRAAPPLPGTLPPTIAISPAAHAPTHMLAVYASAPAAEGKGKTHVTLLPAHALVLAAHCTLLPPLPAAPTTGAQEIPVVPLALPAPGAFPALQAYLYTARADRLCAALLPSLPSSSASSSAVPTPAEVAAHLKATTPCGELEARRALVRGVAADARALGVCDARLWGVLAFAGQALQLALA
ncbi:hypothetical protein HWV62_41511 [Athelia sp. TMB]|nr:hypothetical protein HWV62_41511 [Athelia sp. TMB]